jgi:HEXXH motif-containing protein
LETQVEWQRFAEPQPDQYDSEVALALALGRGWSVEKPASPIVAFDDQVPVLGNEFWDPAEFVPAAPDDPNVRIGCDVIREWPEVFAQCQRLLAAVYISRRKVPSRATWGSCSGAAPSGFGRICATVYHPFGFAEAVVHEMAHFKLRAIGIDMTWASRLLTNRPDELFQSPIRLDKLRPMSAVLHAQYSFTHVAALGIALVQAESSFSSDILRFSLARYIPKLEFGLEVLRRHARTDLNGDRFMAGFGDWVGRVLADGYAVLADSGVPSATFVHPLPPA